MKLLVKKLKDGAVLPFKATEGSSGYDLTAHLDCTILLTKNEVALIPTGIAIEFNDAEHYKPLTVDIQLRMRSSCIKKGLMLVNGVGTIDEDYRGEIMIPVTTFKDSAVIDHGDVIAQLVIVPRIDMSIEEVGTLTVTARDNKGFGSTNEV